MKTNIIYVLNCPITKKPVYVGKSTQGVERPFQHIKEKSHSDKINRWVKYLKERGKEPQVYLVENDVDNRLLDAKETFWINYYLSKGNQLLNQMGIDPTMLLNHKSEIPEDPLYEIRLYVINKRKKLKLSQLELSKKSGVGLRVIRELEQGKKNNFQTDILFKLLNFLGPVKIGIVD
jgi:hypothetical protein